MKKVGIVSCYFKNNYGSLLQAYATQKVLNDNNIPNETINISQLSDFSMGKKKYYLSQITNISFIKAKLGMIKLKIYSKINKKLKKDLAVRNRKFEEFKREFNLTKAFCSYNELSDYSKNRYTDVVVGSDQLWLPVNVIADYYTLNWVPNNVNTISYATSFGVSKIPQKYKTKYSEFLKKINYLSVRESNAVDLIKNIANVDAKLVCDPTLLLTDKEWLSIQQDKPIMKEKYIFCYFLGKNIEHMKFAERLKEKTDFKIVSINHSDEYVKYSDKYADYTPYNIGPAEFINYIKNAEYICTDSFHGTIFSLILNKEFFTFERFKKTTKMSTNSRIYSLLSIVNLENRLIIGSEDVTKYINEKINYKQVNKKIEKFRVESKKWFLDSIQWNEKDIEHVCIEEKEDCCGCTACKNVCPKKAIEMIEDKSGFLYPTVNEEECIKCGLCKKVCPILNRNKEEKKQQDAYVINNKDTEVRLESTSGGAFSAIAKYVIERGGYVFGAAFDEHFQVKHQYENEEQNLSKFRNSKYVQSNPLATFKKAKELLNNNQMVCYSGTPCQIEGLKNYLQEDYPNLILVDVVCRAVPSPKLLRKYLDFIKSTKLSGEKIEKVVFRDKSKYGYKYTLMTIKSKNHIYQEGIDTDSYLRAFFSGLAIRPSCETCKFKKQYRISDFTIWDCFNVEEFNKKMDDNKGSSRILVHTEKGRKIFKEIEKEIITTKVESNLIIKDSKELVKSTKRNPKSNQFFEDLSSKGYEEIVREYFPITAKTRIERFMRRKLVNLKIYKTLKKLAKKILGR